jgi:hypothetical protein
LQKNLNAVDECPKAAGLEVERQGFDSELVTLEPAARREVGGDAGGEQKQADGEGADDPVEFHAALEHEAVEESQYEDQHGCFGEEGGAPVRGDGDQIEEWGWTLFRGSAARGKEDKLRGGGLD